MDEVLKTIKKWREEADSSTNGESGKAIAEVLNDLAVAFRKEALKEQDRAEKMLKRANNSSVVRIRQHHALGRVMELDLNQIKEFNRAKECETLPTRSGRDSGCLQHPKRRGSEKK